MASIALARWSGLTVVLALMLSGCQTLSPALAPCPLSSTEQVGKIQKLAPVGTPRDEVVRRLRQEGIEGDFGPSNSIFYCDTWRQSDGKLWQIQVEVLFDESGKLYDCRIAQPDQAVEAKADSDESAVKKLTNFAVPASSVPPDPFAE